VKYIPDGEIYAMKVLNKKTIIERNEIEHTKAEKSTFTLIGNHSTTFSLSSLKAF